MSNKILTVDDDRDALELLCMTLSSLGYEPQPFTSAEAALKAAPELECAAAFLDIMMPKMDGLTLAGELKKLPNFENTPLIMVTALDKDAEIMEGYSKGADYYITKPYTIAQIKYALELYVS